MAVAVTSQGVGPAFRDVREGLARQFRDVEYAAGSGLDRKDLAVAVGRVLEEHRAEPRVLQKAYAYETIVTRGRIAIDPRDWFVDKLDHGGILRKLRDRWYREAQETTIREEAAWFRRMAELGVVNGGLDMGHIAPGWENAFAGGLGGLLGAARRAEGSFGKEATESQRAFLRSVAIVLTATMDLAERFADLAMRMSLEDPEHEHRLRTVAEVCRQVPAGPPRTFHEALQFTWLMHELIEMEGENVRSMGHFDRVFYPTYRADVDKGRLTPAHAKELIKFYWFKHTARTQGNHNGKNFVFGGQYADGTPVENELTALALEAYDEMNVPDPKLSVRFLPGTSDRLCRSVADMVRRGRNSFVLMNDVPAVAALERMGKTPQDARTYLPIGCYEPAVDGKEAGCTMNLVVNLAKGVELALNDGVDPLSGERVGPRTGSVEGLRSFEDVAAACEGQMRFLIERSVAFVRAHEAQWPQINPSPLLAATIADCLARGKDIGEGGSRYNSVGCVGAGLANACDSLVALKKAVFEEGRVPLTRMREVLASNYEGQEPLRHYLLNRVPKWGNGDPEADAMAVRLVNHTCETVHAQRNGRGGRVQAALFTLTYQWSMGLATGATPDGRRSGESLAPGVGPTSGRDRRGVTGALSSVSKIDFTKTPNGSVVDVTLHPSAVEGEEGLDAFVALIRTFFEAGGYGIQFNVFDRETLRDAQRHPDRYAHLQIRVTGWSVYFNALSRDEQDRFIERHTHGL